MQAFVNKYFLISINWISECTGRGQPNSR